MKSFLFTFICLASSLGTMVTAQVPLGNTIIGTSGDGCCRSVSFSNNGEMLAVGYPNENDGIVRVYQLNQGTWIQVGSDIEGVDENSSFGYSLAISGDGNTLVIGDAFCSINGFYSGQVAMYTYKTGEWVQIGSVINGSSAGNQCGHAVDISTNGKIIAVSSPYNDKAGNDSGITRMFELSGDQWIQKGDNISGEDSNNWSGYDVDLSWSGDTIIIGEIHNSDKNLNSGQVRVFSWTGTTWEKVGQDLNGILSNSFFGNSVSISADGTKVAIGEDGFNSPNGLDVGNVSLFQLGATSWEAYGNSISGTVKDESVGSSVSLSNDGLRVAVGAIESYFQNAGPGLFRVYDWDGSEWVQNGDDIAGDYNEGKFGNAITISGDGERIAAGSIQKIQTSPKGRVKAYQYGPTSNVNTPKQNEIYFYPIPNIW